MSERLEVLKSKIMNGEPVTVFAASRGPIGENTFYLGDLCDIGWAHKNYICDSSGEVDTIEWDYSGPKPITIEYCFGGTRQVLNPGETF